ncbi:replication initiator [uncultured Leifsonia sp.]|uniref:replication initiator n=1 Tax=uncultured Leifsonia sp. TaxID=340359 RepID=UPI0025CCE1FC|nr:replication initiator [uncultured Leifsonia sp.]
MNGRAGAEGGFWGHDPEVPLDLGALSAEAFDSITERLADKSMPALADTLAKVGNCSHPIRLRGAADTFDGTTGELVESFSSQDQPFGLLFKPCGNRREDICPACSRLYARDTFELIATGLHGGKGVPESVKSNPLLFVTLTAPSFGAVHTTRSGKPCRPRSKSGPCQHGRPAGCWAKHDDHDPEVGAPLCADCYDIETAAIWQWFAPELWRRFTIALRRELAAELHVPATKLGTVARLEYAKVAEFQARGAAHFHALIRLDGPDGQGSPAPAPASEIEQAVRAAAAAVLVTAPPVDTDDTARLLRFGHQVDVRTVRHGAIAGDEVTAEQVAAYLTKYSTKSAGFDPRKPRLHLLQLAHTCRILAARALTDCEHGCAHAADEHRGRLCDDCKKSTYGLLGRWSGMLGFRGHFSTKSRRYSVTLGRLRRARRRFQQWNRGSARHGRPLDTAELEARLMADEDEEATLVIGSWIYQGTGWLRDGDKALADAAAARAREHAQWKSGRAA